MSRCRISQATKANQSLGVGRGRNTFPNDKQSTDVRKQSTGARTVEAYRPDVDELSGQVLYMEPECKDTFGSLEALVDHLVEKTIKTGYRPSIYTPMTLDAAARADRPRACVICGLVFPQSAGNKKQGIKDHMDRHFPGRFKCNGDKCGDPLCDYVGHNRADLMTHGNKMNKKHKCEACGRSFSEKTLLARHIENEHVRSFQDVSFASTFG
jgi:rubredoxin